MTKVKLFSIAIFLFIVFSFFSPKIFAKIGVGINTGEIKVEEKLKAGMIYQLPPITIINTGDELADYETTISYHQQQPELRPNKEWFIFSPDKFSLEPGKAQAINIKINLPFETEPGDYFAYLEGHPIATATKGNTVIGVAAATKLYFTISPANFFYAVYYKVSTFFSVYSPWPQRVVLVGLLIGLLFLFKKFFNIEIKTKKSNKKKLMENKEQDE